MGIAKVPSREGIHGCVAVMRRKIIPYNPKLKQLARNLRNKSTLAEVILWRHLKGKQIYGYDFHRQKPINNYIVDFYCPELMLVIEIDGSTHGDKIKYDELRERKLKGLGVKFLRFQDRDIKNNISGVLDNINDWVDKNKF